MINRWFREKVVKGDGSGKKIGFPTLNLDKQKLEGKIKEGIYACLVRYKKKVYPGVLFYGPRLVTRESHNVLEIYVIDFDKNIYGRKIEYKVKNFIRKVKNFKGTKELREEIAKDVAKTLKLLTNTKVWYKI